MLSAIFFDLDGTLTNTDTLHFHTWQTALQELNMAIDRAFYDSRISGRLNEQIVQDILPQLPLKEGLEVAEAKEAQFREKATQLEPLPGLLKLLKWIEKQELKQAVVTNAPRSNAEFMLNALQLNTVFPIVILAEEADSGKPHPAPYLLALHKLGVPAQEVIAFEDSPSGVASAVSAGIQTFGIASTHDPKDLLEAGAKKVFFDFTDESLWDFLFTVMKNRNS